MATTGIFDNYETDYNAISQSISKKLNTQLPVLSGEARRTLVRAIERELDEADEILQSMEMELMSLPTVSKSKLQPKMKGYRTDYDKLKAEFKRINNKNSERAELLGRSDDDDGFHDPDIASMDQRATLLSNTNRLDKTSKRLEDSHRIALETEQIGIGTLETLRNQRQQLERANQNLDEANGFIDRNVRILKSMGRRAAANRVMTFGIIAALIFIIILILVAKFS
ncbi:hypothetical protein MP228_001094 [Amoeboaphelidium protococcarum]|nr:hypothetical protein MP228_001094 [Amoeboaphelidium protococcarum]